MESSAVQQVARVKRCYYADSVEQFLSRSDAEIINALAQGSSFAIETTQRDAWNVQITILRQALQKLGSPGWIAFEFDVPRVGRRIDVLLIVRHVIFVLEFKVGEKRFSADATEQVWDYALDLKNFHSTSHDKRIAPILVATEATSSGDEIASSDHDGVLRPIHACPTELSQMIERVLSLCEGAPIDIDSWTAGYYSPTPTIIDAAISLYGRHSVADISRSDAAAINLTRTSAAIARVIESAKSNRAKAVCFVTGVPGAGKTLVGLNVATEHIDKESDLYSVFLSGNGPLVAILREALARDKVRREAAAGRKIKKGGARSEVKAFIQNVHNFRDDCLVDIDRPPIEHVALFDEAQRAWNKEQTASFMRRKKKRPNFSQSEPEFLIDCMNRHSDWAVVVCLVGGGQEINTGEAGIGEWIDAILRSFNHWQIHLSPNLHDSEFAAGTALEALAGRNGVHFNEDLHLAVSMRSFRAENVSALVKQLLDIDLRAASSSLAQLRDRYPIVITRDLGVAKSWLKEKARGTERYGLVVSSQAQRLKPHAIDVRAPLDPIHWFLDAKTDVRSSFYLEDAATEFDVQGLELDWSGVVWDGDFRYSADGWKHWMFRGDKWQRIKAAERQAYLKNAYRVLLTRARQGMVIVVPKGDPTDPTRDSAFYDPTFEYLREAGFEIIG